jgi:hypothetical protein
MRDQRQDQASCRRPGKTGRDSGGSGAQGRSDAAPGVPPAVRTALATLRDAAAAHDDKLPAPQLPAARLG